MDVGKTLFAQIKQHLRIKKSLGTSKNAVKTQLWCAIATDVLIAIVKKKLQLDASLDTCRQILSLSVLENTEISCALQTHHSKTKPTTTAIDPASVNLKDPTPCLWRKEVQPDQ